MKVQNWEDYLDDDSSDSNFVKLTKKVKIINHNKEDMIRLKRREKAKRQAAQLNSYEKEA